MIDRRTSGQVLPAVIIMLVVMTISIFALTTWVQNDSKTAIRVQKNTSAINFAEAGINRGTWKLQSSTSTWDAASSGQVITGYNFDATLTDIPGGSYRIKFTAGPLAHEVTILAEGRDNSTKQVRALSVVQKNLTIYSALMSAGNVTWAKGLCLFWGPIISQGNIQMMDDYTAALYGPLKYARSNVIGTTNYPRDTSFPSPPNTDNVEWWANYSGIPSVPVLDFVSLRSSAAATGTLNVYGCKNSSPAGAWDTRASCGSSGSHAGHFGNSWNHPKSAKFNPNTNYVWYWDGDVTLSGNYCGNSPCGQSTGLRGTFIVRGNLTIDTPGEYNYTGPVPANAWQQHNKLTKNTFDTNASNEYPADNGYHNSGSTFNFGSDTWCQPNASGCGWTATVGLRGLTYVGGNLTILQFLDFNGAVWVNGSVTATGGTNSTFCSIFYDDTLDVPALNVILLRQSWTEITPSTTVWN